MTCAVCLGRGYVPAPGTAEPECDACPRCAWDGEVAWMAMEARMQRREVAPVGEAGTVTIGTVRASGALLLEVVAYPAVLRVLPWFRGRMGVATSLLPWDRLEIARAGLGAPYRLLARMDNPLDKLPPVQLRIPALPHIAGEHPAEPAAWQAGSAVLILTLPPWARQATPPREIGSVAA